MYSSKKVTCLIILCLTLQCLAESDQAVDFGAEEELLFDDNTKNFNRNRCSFREQYFDCPGAPECQRTCSNLNEGCSMNANCVPGCYCIGGYARDTYTNECIPIKQCPGASCPRNEIFNTCYPGSRCERTCAERNTPCNSTISCEKVCQCRFGYFRDPTSNSCVREKYCLSPPSDPPRCPRNEHYDTCGSACKETCPGNQNCATECKSGCFCNAGLVRIKGRCVEASICTRNCPTGERPDCILPCSESCDPKACDGITGTICRKQCVCSLGAKRNPEGKCVPKDDCLLLCGDFEEEGTIVPCTESCNPNECTKDPPSTTKVRMCICKGGYKRHENGTCIEETKCPLICPENEEENTIVPCSESCDPNECTKDPPSTTKVRMCICKGGYKRHENGTCIEETKCPLICPENEEENTIVPCSESCDPNECTKIPSQTEVKMCTCINGFKRHLNGTCVAECPTCPDGEVFALTVACDELCDGYACENQNGIPTLRCSCKNGQKRQFNTDGSPGQCVDQTECNCLDPNAIYGCLNKCHNDCASTHIECEHNASNDGCVSSCYCIDDHRLVNGTCKPLSECECGTNEKYKPDGNRCLESCTPLNCDPSLDTGPGCYCDDNYARVDGTCLAKSTTCEEESSQQKLNMKVTKQPIRL